ncbi:MAG: UbiA family prenyltransferase [Candidatus Zixiibacteriota bacterium]|nr:MAG: UbiA family prenyltransferase [candidate division Zixibacteria bacterium]
MKIIDFVFAARPMLHLPIWSIFLISNHAISGKSLSLESLCVLVGLSLMATGAYYLNQISDYPTDLMNRKLGFLQAGFITRRELIAAGAVVSLTASVTAFFIDYRTGTIFILLFLLGYAYSAPPLRLKDQPVPGLLANSIGYGLLIPLTVPGMLHYPDQSRMYFPVYFFLVVSAGYLLTIIPDREGDRGSGKRTLAVLLSDRALIALALVILLMSIAIALTVASYVLVAVSVISTVLLIVAWLVASQMYIMLSCKLPILLLSLLAGYYYPGYLLFLVVLLIVTRLYYRRRFGMVYPRLN